MNKYKNIKCQYRGKKFDSRKEMMRYIELESMQKRGEISALTCQFKLEYEVNDKHGFYLIIDFAYVRDCKIVYEDVKAFDVKTQKFLTTPVFNLKKKLICLADNITIELF